MIIIRHAGLNDKWCHFDGEDDVFDGLVDHVDLLPGARLLGRSLSAAYRIRSIVTSGSSHLLLACKEVFQDHKQTFLLLRKLSTIAPFDKGI